MNSILIKLSNYNIERKLGETMGSKEIQPNPKLTTSSSEKAGASQSQASSSIADSQPTLEEQINKLNSALVEINSIKNQLTQLPLNPQQLNYFNNNVSPLLVTLNNISAASFNLSGSINTLTNSIIVHGKESKLRDTIHLIYKLNEECEDIYEILERRIDTLLHFEEKK
mgnify:CR=1 FL=1